jgi:hypothetical protein
MNLAEESAVGNSLPFGKEIVALILWDCVVMWPERKERMDGQAIMLRDKLSIESIRGHA